MNEKLLYTLAGLAMSFAGFTGVVVALPRDRRWTARERRMLWLLISDSFLTLFLALLPVVLALAGWSPDTIWVVCGALLASWFSRGAFVSFRADDRDSHSPEAGDQDISARQRWTVSAMSLVMAGVMWLSVFDILVSRGQAVYVTGLLVLLGFSAMEFLYFIGLLVREQSAEEG